MGPFGLHENGTNKQLNKQQTDIATTRSNQPSGRDKTPFPEVTHLDFNLKGAFTLHPLAGLRHKRTTATEKQK